MAGVKEFLENVRDKYKSVLGYWLIWKFGECGVVKRYMSGMNYLYIVGKKDSILFYTKAMIWEDNILKKKEMDINSIVIIDLKEGVGFVVDNPDCYITKKGIEFLKNWEGTALEIFDNKVITKLVHKNIKISNIGKKILANDERIKRFLKNIYKELKHEDWFCKIVEIIDEKKFKEFIGWLAIELF